jgi:hypothetical protein
MSAAYQCILVKKSVSAAECKLQQMHKTKMVIVINAFVILLIFTVMNKIVCNIITLCIFCYYLEGTMNICI